MEYGGSDRLSLGAKAGNRALQAPPATGTDQQRSAPNVLPARERLPVGLGAQLGRQGQAGPVGQVKQPDHFCQADHGETIRGKSAGEAGTPPRLVNYALCRPGTRTARVTATRQRGWNRVLRGAGGLEPTTGGL